jgi:selenocysteine-specific elongation factor
VVTGTLISGAIRKEEELQVFPGERRVRVRGVQVHGQSEESALAGRRTALNLGGVSTSDLARGMSLGPPDTFVTTDVIDVQLRLLRSAPRALKNRSRVHLHSNTMETLAEIVLHETKQLEPGSDVFARLKLADAALLLPGDRFIIRQFSPVVTIGGGRVLDAAPLTRKFEPGGDLETFAAEDSAAIVRSRVARRDNGVDVRQLIAETGWRRSSIESLLASAIKGREVVQIGEILLSMRGWEALKSQVVPRLEEFHARNSLVSGISREELRAGLGAREPVFEFILRTLVQEKKIEVAGDLVRLPGRGVAMKDEEAESKKKIEEAFASAALKVPALQEVIAGLKIDKVRAQKIVTLLLRDKILTKVSDDLVFHRTALEDLRRRIANHKSKSATIDVAGFKDLTGVSRKYAIPLLEYLDRERVTKRVGDVRQIL